MAEPTNDNQVKPAWYWVKDAAGYGSITATLLFVSFWVTTIAYILSVFEKLGPLQIRQFDVAACSAYFVPILTLYFGRKWTEAKYPNQTQLQAANENSGSTK